MRLPAKYLVDTNVAVSANYIANEDITDIDLINCLVSCVNLLSEIVNKNEAGIVLDYDDEIFHEYKKNLDFSGQPGVGDRFFKWLHDNRHSFPPEDRVPITKEGNSYTEFPDHSSLVDFDEDDRKFIATSNKHPASPKPPIFEAVDCKWWGWKDALVEVGIEVIFLNERYIRKTYQQKFGR